MADIEKISVSGTSYDVRDANAAHALTDVAVAGTGIVFNDALPDYTVVGSCIVNDQYIASNFSDSSYILSTKAIPANCTDWEIVTKITTTDTISGSSMIMVGAINYAIFIGLWEGNEGSTFGDGSVWFSETTPMVYIDDTVNINTVYWYKVSFNGTKYSIERSTDGVTFTEIMYMQNSNTLPSTAVVFGKGDGNLVNEVDLTETYIKANGEYIWRAVNTDKTEINALVDQTYNASSTNAQSGVAINGAGFLTKNVDRVAIGQSSSAASQSVAIGYEATASGTQGVAIGGYGASAARQCIAIGNNVSANTNYNALAIGFGANSSSKTRATGYGSIAIGYACISTAYNTIAIGDNARAQNDKAIAIGPTAFAQNDYAIQLGRGTNDTANTFSVGLSASNNYRLLESDGTIPSARMPSDVVKNTATRDNSLSILGESSVYQYSVNIGHLSGVSNSGCTALGYNAKARYANAVAIGCDTYADNSNCTALGWQAKTYASYAIQLGQGSNSTANTFSVGLSDSNNYRLLNSDGTIPGERMALQGDGAPTTATVGSVGQFYVDTTNQVGYMCVSTADSTYVWKQITA